MCRRFLYSMTLFALMPAFMTGCAYLPFDKQPDTTSTEVVAGESMEADRARVEAYLAAGEDEKAGALTEHYLGVAPDDVGWRNLSALLADRAGEHEKAQGIYLALLSDPVLPPSDAEYTRNNLALSYLVDDQTQSAISLLQPHLKTAERPKAVRQLLALAYGAAGEDDKAYELGLADLGVEEVAENMGFYRQFRTTGFNRKLLLHQPAN